MGGSRGRVMLVLGALALTGFVLARHADDAAWPASDRPAGARPAFLTTTSSIGASLVGRPSLPGVTAAASNAYFQEVVGAIPDLAPIYDQSEMPMQVRPIPVDLDGNGRDDLLLHMYFFNFGGAANNDPCRNQLVVLMHQADGSFVDETATRIAGSPDLQACSSDFAVADVNADGKPDVVFANSQEDGRNVANSADANALNSALVSRPDGRYGVERFGEPAWHYGVALPRDANGQVYLIVSSYNHAPEPLRRMPNGTWATVATGVPYTEANMSVFHRADGSAGPSTLLIRNAKYPNNFDIAGAFVDGNGAWQETPDLRLFDYVGMVNLITWANVPSVTPVVKVGDDYALAGTFLRGCTFRESPGAPPAVVSKAQAGFLPVDYTGPDQVVSEGDLVRFAKLERFRIVGGEVVSLPLSIAGERIRQVGAEYHACQDINGDGYDDLVVYQEGATGAPLAYVNNGHGGLRYIGSEPFPAPPVDWGMAGMSLLHDFDHDGIVDYFSCPCVGRSSQFNNDVTYHFYKGVAPLPNLSVPGQPLDAFAQAGSGSARVWFSPPLDDGGLPISGYTVRSVPAGGVDTQAGSGSNDHLVTGLANGTSYRFVVVAQNAKGEGNPSLKSAAVTPVAQVLSVAPVSVSEGQAGTSLANFVISLSAPSSQPVTVDVHTEPGSALQGVDYLFASANGLTIPAGQTSVGFQVPIVGDTVVEGNESFVVVLSNVAGANLGTARALGRILNDDLALLYIDDPSVVEGNAGQTTLTFRISLSEPMPTPVTFDIGTQGQGALSGVDFLPRSQSGKLLDAGRSSTTFEVAVLGDTAQEADETLWAVLSNVQGAILQKAVGNGTIVNDDAGAVAPGRVERTGKVKLRGSPGGKAAR